MKSIDTGLLRSYHLSMPLWRCPHCGTPQPEAARCWVCQKSSTTCATCRNYRRAIAANVGFCGLDRGRSPLRGDETRGCWDEMPAVQVDDAGQAGIAHGAVNSTAPGPGSPRLARDWAEVGAGAGPGSARARTPDTDLRESAFPSDSRERGGLPALAQRDAGTIGLRVTLRGASPDGLWGDQDL